MSLNLHSALTSLLDTNRNANGRASVIHHRRNDQNNDDGLYGQLNNDTDQAP